ncbi:hypothetical protein ACJJTC_009916 [Scirpophaga incertulas]
MARMINRKSSFKISPINDIMHFIIIFTSVFFISDSMPIDNGEAIETVYDKDALRYGFHRIENCDNYELAFMCIRKCIDYKYDIAYADKKCTCSCFHNKMKSNYKNKIVNTTEWRLGAPTTKLPIWAQTVTVTDSDEDVEEITNHIIISIGTQSSTQNTQEVITERTEDIENSNYTTIKTETANNTVSKNEISSETITERPRDIESSNDTTIKTETETETANNTVPNNDITSETITDRLEDIESSHNNIYSSTNKMQNISSITVLNTTINIMQNISKVNANKTVPYNETTALWAQTVTVTDSDENVEETTNHIIISK